MRSSTFEADLKKRITELSHWSDPYDEVMCPLPEALVNRGADLARGLFAEDARLGDCYLSACPYPGDEIPGVSLDFGRKGVGGAGILIPEEGDVFCVVSCPGIEGSPRDKMTFDPEDPSEVKLAANFLVRYLWNV